MTRKIAGSLLITILLLTALTSCKPNKISEEDLGRINSVEIGKAAKEESQFDERDCPFTGYALTSLDYDSAMMSLKIPSSWDVRIENPSLIRLSVPMSDQYFPGNTFYIQSLFDYNTNEEEFTENAGDVKKLYAPFITYLEGFKYSIAGSKEGSLRRWRGGWDSIKESDLAIEDNIACTGVIADEILYDKKTSEVVAQNVGLVATFFKWHGFPVMISTFALRGEMDDAKKMTEYIMSTAAFKTPKIAETEEKSFGKKITGNLPAEYKSSAEAPNVYRGPSNTAKSTAGLAIGVFEVPDVFTDKTKDAQSLMNQYGEYYILDLVDPSCASLYTPSINVTGEGEESFVGEERSFFANCSMITKEDPPVSAYKMYGPASTLYMNCYVVKRNEKNYLVASLFPQHQSELSYAIERLLIKSLKVK